MRITARFRVFGLAFLVGALAVPACFSPDRSRELDFDDDDDDDANDDAEPPGPGSAGESDDHGDAVCTELEQTCESNGDCPCFDGSSEVGTALCLGDGEAGLCTGICQQGSDCETGCCAALEGDPDYGACAPASVCDGGAASETCLEGVSLFCACAASAGVSCSADEQESFAATCEDPGHSLHDVFECWGSFSGAGLEACSDGLEACEI